MMMMMIAATTTTTTTTNLIHTAQFDTKGIPTALYIVKKYVGTQYIHILTYMKQSYSYTYTCLHI